MLAIQAYGAGFNSQLCQIEEKECIIFIIICFNLKKIKSMPAKMKKKNNSV